MSARKTDSYMKYERVILEYRDNPREDYPCQFWSADGMPLLEYDLLVSLVNKSISDGDTSQSGGLAKALDMWIAEQLRNAGFDSQAIWPRLHAPRVLDPSVLRFINSLDAKTAEACCKKMKKFSSSTASVLGSAYTKQVDVGLSSWMTGPEIMISTKTMLSSFRNNLVNRFEEAYGDAKNLKGRHPLCSLGFFFLINSSIADVSHAFAKAVSMLEKLQLEADAYDATCMLLVDFHEDGSSSISSANNDVPKSLSPEAFFKEMIGKTLLRASPDAHDRAREKSQHVDFFN